MQMKYFKILIILKKFKKFAKKIDLYFNYKLYYKYYYKKK